MDNQRIEKWDIARGALIFLVVFGHMAEYYCDESRLFKAIFVWLYLFHMPCFLFLDGLFSKKTINEKRYHKIFSYLLMYLTAKVLIALAKCATTHSMSFTLLSESGVPWYGLALFLCCLLTIFLKDFPKRWVLIFWIILACFTGYDTTIKDYLVLSRVIVFFPFFFLGYCIDAKEFMQWLDNIRLKVFAALFLVGYTAVIFFNINDLYFLRALATGRNPFSVFGSAYELEGLVVYGGLFRFAYYLVALCICSCFLSLMPKRLPKFTGLSTFGKRSLQIYLLHRPLIYLLFDGTLKLKTIQLGSSLELAIALLFGAAVMVYLLSWHIWEKPIRKIIYPSVSTR